MQADTKKVDVHKGPTNTPAFDKWVRDQEAAGETWATRSPLQEWLIYVNGQLAAGANPVQFFGGK